MPDHKLHVISFDIPDPPDYGGVIDVFYKLVYLHHAGVRIILHCFEYGRTHSAFLESICDKVYYYPRKTGMKSQLGIKPYIVNSRRSDLLLKRLIDDDYPILFEGLHTCYLIGHPLLKSRFKAYRESNIEHHYYYHLFKAENNIFRKLFFYMESLRLKLFEKHLKNARVLMAVSKDDFEYLKGRFPGNSVLYLPSFHPNNQLDSLPGMGDFILYHGNLEVAENLNAAMYLIRNVFSKTNHKVIIAGKNPDQKLISLASAYNNIQIIANPDQEKMMNLVKNAHIHVLITFQATGLKLKLLNTLFQGRSCIVNPEMVAGTGLEHLCEMTTDSEEILRKIDELFKREFNNEEIENRAKVLLNNYSNSLNISRLIDAIF